MASPSARKVWIEISDAGVSVVTFRSPSARKVWIEIAEKAAWQECQEVTFREEGVD